MIKNRLSKFCIVSSYISHIPGITVHYNPSLHSLQMMCAGLRLCLKDEEVLAEDQLEGSCSQCPLEVYIASTSPQQPGSYLPPKHHHLLIGRQMTMCDQTKS